MADEEAEVVEEATAKTREGAEQAKALDSVTDLVDEKQLDEGRVKKAMQALAQAQKADKEAQRKREKELAAVKINADDVSVIASEFEMDKKAAERRLREHSGNLVAALKSLL